MRTKKILSTAVSTMLMTTLITGTVFAADEGFPGDMQGGMQQPGNTSYSHGSDVSVTEDMLTTEEDIPADYDVNENTQGSAKKGEYTSLFNTEDVENVYLDIDENNWNYMLQNALDKPNVLLDGITIDGYEVNYASIKTKGNLTLNSVWQSDSDRFSFTVNIGKYIKKKNGYSDNQNLFGLTKVAFNNIYGDATLMKEYLSYELMTEMGIPTPCYSLVNLYVNDEFYGVYMMVESIDDTLTKRTLGESSDYLVKPESQGGDLVYNTALDAYYNEETESFDFGSLLDSMPSDASNPLYSYGGLWENDEDTFDDVKDMLPTVFKWMKTLNEISNDTDVNSNEYQEALESIVDVDSLIRYFAVNTYLVNLDSYQSEKMQNYALYINEDGQATVMPWDYNYSFGTYGMSSANDMVNFDIYNPVLNTTLAERPLLNAILQNDDYKTLYEEYLNDCTVIASEGGVTSDGESYAANNFATQLDAFNVILNEQDGNSYSDDPTAFYTLDRYNTATQSFKQLITDRSKAVLKQLSGDTTKVETTVNLQDLGDTTGGAGGMQPGDNGGSTDAVQAAVTEVTSGSVFDTVKETLKAHNQVQLFRINVGMNQEIPAGEENGAASEIPAGGETGTAPEIPVGGETGTAPEMPAGEENGMMSDLTVNIPVVTTYTQYTVAAYAVTADGQVSEITGSFVDGNYVVVLNPMQYPYVALAVDNTADETITDTVTDNTLSETVEETTVEETTTEQTTTSAILSGTVATGDTNSGTIYALLATAAFAVVTITNRRNKKVKN